MSKKHKKRQAIKAKGISPKLIVALVVTLFVGVALFLRIVLPYDDIFTAYGVKFSGNDAYYYMRLVDNMVSNFPHLGSVDPYLIYPDGQPILTYYFFARLLASVSWLVGLGHPSQQLVDAVCAYIPAILGALVVIPVYFIGKELGGRWCGLISAALIAVLPGEFLGRSILGHADHHVAEVLFSTMSMLFLAMAIKCARQKISVKPIVYSLFAGLFLGIYGLTWQAGLLFLFVTSLYFVVQFVIDHLKYRSVYYLCVVGVVFNLVAMVVFLPSVIWSSSLPFFFASMGGALLLSLAMGGLSWLMVKIRWRAFYYPIAVLGLGTVGLAIFYLVSPSLFKEVIGVFSFVFAPTSTQLTTIEMQSLLFPNGTFTLSLVWGNFGLTIFVAIASLAVLVWDMARHGDAVKSLVVVWTVVILAMALGQRRFAYYLAVNATLLAGYLSWKALEWAGLKEWQGSRAVKAKSRRVRSAVGSGASVALVAVVVFTLLFGSIIPSVGAVAGTARYAPSDAWCESLDWLRNNSPEPFPNGYDTGASYGILSWWDYGYWIARVARRVPYVNPGQDIVRQTEVAEFLTSQDDLVSDGKIYPLGAKYVIVDIDTVVGKFWAVARYAGREQVDFFDIYYVEEQGQLVPVQVYYPDYYRSLSVRLFNFDGKAVVPQSVIAISCEDRVDMRGVPFKFVTDVKQFVTYEDAEDYMSSQQAGNWRVVSADPFASPLPLEGVECYELVYSSEQKVSVGSAGGTSSVKIFKCVD